MIPLTMDSIPKNTIYSIVKQEYKSYEIIILQNGASSQIDEVKEEELKTNLPLRKFKIRRKGKGYALNIGISYAKYEYICVLDADCILEKSAIKKAIKHFSNKDVIAVGGKLKVTNDKKNLLTYCQEIEYSKTFNIWRFLSNHFNANYLISGAFGIFKKEDLLNVGGFNEETIGEDMELVLNLQEKFRSIGKKIVYEKESICYTEVPWKMKRLLHQRDRWQRGLLDCLLRHKKMILNPSYGLLGLVALPWLVIFELLGPIFILLNLANLIFAVMGNNYYFELLESIKIVDIYQSWLIYFIYLGFEVFLTCFARFLENKKAQVFITKLPEAIAATILGTLLSIPLALARLYGMITFHWRKHVW